jgi:hypothetical protein
LLEAGVSYPYQLCFDGSVRDPLSTFEKFAAHTYFPQQPDASTLRRIHELIEHIE